MIKTVLRLPFWKDKLKRWYSKMWLGGNEVLKGGCYWDYKRKNRRDSREY